MKDLDFTFWTRCAKYFVIVLEFGVQPAFISGSDFIFKIWTKNSLKLLFQLSGYRSSQNHAGWSFPDAALAFFTRQTKIQPVTGTQNESIILQYIISSGWDSKTCAVCFSLFRQELFSQYNNAKDVLISVLFIYSYHIHKLL